MVKYLSDNRTDQRFQTILSKSQPFQAEVASEMYPVDEVDLGPSLNMVQNLAGAYTRQQGQELQREGMAINYSAYQANRAAQQAEKSQKENQQALKNTMLNDYGAEIAKIADKINQGIYTPAQGERALRDVRYDYMKNGGAVVNVNDLTAVEKGTGLTLTKDLIQAQLTRENEAVAAEMKDYRDSMRAWASQMYGEETAKGMTLSEIERDYTHAKNITDTALNNILTDGQIYNTTDDPAIYKSPDGYHSPATAESLGKVVDGYFQSVYWQGLTKEGGLSPEDIDTATDVATQMLTSMYISTGQRVNPAFINGIVRNRLGRAGLIKASNFSQANLAAKKEELENVNAIRKATMVTPKEVMNQAAKAQREYELNYNVENGNVLMWMAENPQLVDAISRSTNDKAIAWLNNALDSINLEGALTGGNYGKGLSNAVNMAIERDPQSARTIAQGNLQYAHNAVDNQGPSGYYTSKWDIPAGIGAIQNRATVLQPTDTNPNDPEVMKKEDNTAFSRSAIEELHKDKDSWDSLSREEREDLSKFYMENTSRSTVVNLNRLRENGWAENIRYDSAKNMFVPVNITEDQESFYKAGTGLETLWPALDNLNDYINEDFEGFNESLKDLILDSTGILELQPTDKVFRRSSSVRFAQAIGEGEWKEAAQNVIGTTAELTQAATGIPGAIQAVAEGRNPEEALKEGLFYKVGEAASKVAETAVEKITSAVLDGSVKKALEAFKSKDKDVIKEYVEGNPNITEEDIDRAFREADAAIGTTTQEPSLFQRALNAIIPSAGAAELPREWAESITSEVERADMSKMPEEVDRDLILKAAQIADIPEEEIYYKLGAESTRGLYTPTKKDKNGKILAAGIMQVGEGAKDEVEKHSDLMNIVKDIAPNSTGDLLNPLDNFAYGVAYMKYCEQRVEKAIEELKATNIPVEDKVDLVRLAYNAGDTGIKTWIKKAKDNPKGWRKELYQKYKTYLGNHTV